MTKIKYGPRDYRVGRHELPQQTAECPGCGKVFTFYRLRIECRVCKVRPRDFNGRLIEVGDRFFIGNPPAFGRVIRIRKSSIELEIGSDRQGRNRTQRAKSPDQGICVDKVPEGL